MPTRIRSAFRNAAEWLRRRHLDEPARVRAVWTALAGVAVSLGITLPTGLDGRVDAVIAAVFGVLPLLQGESTRAAVYAPSTVIRRTTDAYQRGLDAEDPPGRHAAVDQ